MEDFARIALVVAPEIAEYHGVSISEREKLFISECAWTDDDMKKIEENAQKIPKSLIEKISAVGSVDDIIAKIDIFIKSGADHIILADVGSELEESMRILGEKVLPYFKD